MGGAGVGETYEIAPVDESVRSWNRTGARGVLGSDEQARAVGPTPHPLGGCPGAGRGETPRRFPGAAGRLSGNAICAVVPPIWKQAIVDEASSSWCPSRSEESSRRRRLRNQAQLDSRPRLQPRARGQRPAPRRTGANACARCLLGLLVRREGIVGERRGFSQTGMLANHRPSWPNHPLLRREGRG